MRLDVVPFAEYLVDVPYKLESRIFYLCTFTLFPRTFYLVHFTLYLNKAP